MLLSSGFNFACRFASRGSFQFCVATFHSEFNVKNSVEFKKI